MNCSAAQRLLSAERDGALATRERADLDGHVAGCAECGRFRAMLAETGEQLRGGATRVKVPDEERAWQDIHREIRAGRAGGARAGLKWGRWALPFGAAATLALVAVLLPNGSDPDGAQAAGARAEFVEVSGDASSMVYVDDKSGWLVVWAESPVKSG